MQKEWEKAVLDGDVDLVKRLADEGADVDARDRHSQTALMLASLHGHAGVVRVLVDRGANLDVRAKYNLTPLMLAVVNDHDEVARILVEAGADRSLCGSGAPGFDGKTAFDLAVERGSTTLARLLEPPGDE